MRKDTLSAIQTLMMTVDRKVSIIIITGAI